MNWIGLLPIAGCLLVLILATVGWNLVELHWKGRLLTRLLGRTGARLFMGFLGIAVGVLGVLMLLGIVG